jgi:voltage-gated potassium channel Kch
MRFSIYRSISSLLIKSQYYLLSIAFIFSLISGYLGFKNYYALLGKEIDCWNSLYLTIQLFVVQSGNIDGTVPLFLQIARFLAPLTLAIAAIKTVWAAFKKEVYALKVKSYKKHSIICGLGAAGQVIADNLLKANKKVIIIEKDPFNNSLSSYKAKGAYIIAGNSSDPAILKNARIETAKNIIAVTGDDILNIEIVHQSKSLKNLKDKKYNLTAFAHINDYKMRNILYENPIFMNTEKAFDGRIFNIYENAVRVAIRDHAPDIYKPIYADSEYTQNILIVGFKALGEYTLLQLAKSSHYINGRKANITIIDEDIEKSKNTMNLLFPALNNIVDISWIERKPDLIDAEIIDKLQDKNKFSIVYLCVENDARQVLILSKLKYFLPDPVLKFVVFIFFENSVSSSILKNERIIKINVIESGCALDIVLNDTLDALAKIIHENYLKRERINYEKRKAKARENGEETPKPKDSMVEWSELNEEYRDSNRSQAEHIDIKLRALQYKQVLINDPRPEEKIPDDPATLKKLGIMEHNRWNADKWLAGWKFGKDRVDKLKIHDNLISWEKLSDEIKSYDIDTVKEMPELLKSFGKKTVKNK